LAKPAYHYFGHACTQVFEDGACSARTEWRSWENFGERPCTLSRRSAGAGSPTGV